ncbi:MAG: hypothetical protein AAFP03_12285 [Cyanobacteria bacterium J06598_3]
MTSATFSTSLEAQQAAALLEGYRFELGNHDARQWVSLWLEFYKPNWIRDAVVEALYQGRYKSVSVRQILDLWQRRAKPIRHVTHEFEAAVCREFGEVKIRTAMPAITAGRHKSTRPLTGQSAQDHSASRQSIHGQSTKNQSAQGQFDAVRSVRKSTLSKRASASSNVSFNLAELAAAPGMEPLGVSVAQQATTGALGQTVSSGQSKSSDPKSSDMGLEQTVTPLKKRSRPLDNKAWREFANYTTPTHAPSPSDTEETLRIQRQFNGVLYSSARAIQPFKPALPFSAKTLRHAKQKALAESL